MSSNFKKTTCEDCLKDLNYLYVKMGEAGVGDTSEAQWELKVEAGNTWYLLLYLKPFLLKTS